MKHVWRIVTDNRIKIPESENDEDFIPDVKAEKEYASEIARENRPIRRKGFGMTERIKRLASKFIPRNRKNRILNQFDNFIWNMKKFNKQYTVWVFYHGKPSDSVCSLLLFSRWGAWKFLSLIGEDTNIPPSLAQIW